MFVQIALAWGIIMTLLKFANIVACSWFIIWIPLPIALVLFLCALMYLSYQWSGSVKFWEL